MKCFRCGSEVADGLRYCGYCGIPVTDPQASTMVVESQTEGLIERVRMVLTGEYEVEAELARGGMGIVFKAREVGLGRVVALKVLSPELSLNVRAAERFKREARMVADLDHASIVPVYRVGQIGDVLFIAMKFVEGRPLGKAVEVHGAVPIPVVLQVLRSASRALAYAHERGIVHRDVKGDNILVDHEGRVLVADFGVALRAADVTLTVDGSVIGTPAFMSPEQCLGKRAGPQSDQYSLGVVAFHMLAGAVPFSSETIAGYLQQHLSTPVPDIRPVRDDIPEGLVAVVNRTLAKEPTERFDTTRQMVEAIEAIPFSEAEQREGEEMLRRLAQGGDVATVSTRFVSPIPDAGTLVLKKGARSRRRAVVAVVTGTVLALVGGALWTGTRQARPTVAREVEPVGTDMAAVGATAPSTQPAGLEGPSSPAAAAANGRLRLSTTPPDAQILVDRRSVGVGIVYDLPVAAGTRRIQARSAGYVTYDTVVSFSADQLVNLGRVTLRARDNRP